MYNHHMPNPAGKVLTLMLKICSIFVLASYGEKSTNFVKRKSWIENYNIF